MWVWGGGSGRGPATFCVGVSVCVRFVANVGHFLANFANGNHQGRQELPSVALKSNFVVSGDVWIERHFCVAGISKRGLGHAIFYVYVCSPKT